MLHIGIIVSLILDYRLFSLRHFCAWKNRTLLSSFPTSSIACIYCSKMLLQWLPGLQAECSNTNHTEQRSRSRWGSLLLNWLLISLSREIVKNKSQLTCFLCDYSLCANCVRRLEKQSHHLSQQDGDTHYRNMVCSVLHLCKEKQGEHPNFRLSANHPTKTLKNKITNRNLTEETRRLKRSPLGKVCL